MKIIESIMNRRTVIAASTVALVGCIGPGTEIGSVDKQYRSNYSSQNDGSLKTGERGRENSGDDGGPTREIELFDDFSDLTRWSVLNGSVEGDDKRGQLGSQSAHLAAGPGDDRVTISHTLSEPIDCSSKNPGLSLAAAESVVPTVQLIDREGNRVDFRRGIKGGRHTMRYNFGIEDIYGDPDLSTVTEIRITLWAGDRSYECWVDGLYFVPRPDTGKVMIQFDDGYETDYTEALPILDRYDYPAATFVNPGRIGNDEFLNLGQCERLQDAGWTVANHTHTHAHLESLDPDEQRIEIVDAKEWLVDHGFERGARYFAYPFGEWDEYTLEVVEEHHELAFWGGRGVHGHPVNPILCTRESEDPAADRAIAALDAAARWGGHVRFFYHRLTGEQLSEFEATIEHLHELESTGEVEIVLPGDLEQELVD